MDALSPMSSRRADSSSLRAAIWFLVAAAVGLLALWRSRLQLPSGRLIPLALAALLLALTGVVAAAVMDWARQRAGAQPMPRRWRIRAGDPRLIGQTARWPQAIIVTLLGCATIAAAWFLPPTGSLHPAQPWVFQPWVFQPWVDEAYGAAAILLAFPLLIIERTLAATPEHRVREASDLRCLLLLAVLTWSVAGAVQIGGALGLPLTDLVDRVLAMPLILVAAELCLRALGRCFLPPPPAEVARAACESVVARIIAEGIRTGGLAAPVRQHLGIDFSRSWALAFLRAATPPAFVLLLLICWGLTGVVLVGLDQRAVYERFGAPVAVLHSGLHVILPYPLGRARRGEFGTLHEIALTDAEPAMLHLVGAEDLPPPEADRLWEQAHPAELVFLIASESSGQQSFQVVSADIKLRYRIGLSDQAGLEAAYQVSDPQMLLRNAAGRIIAGFFAQQTLEAVLGENREAVAEDLRRSLQAELDRLHSGLELTALVIEAIHPPAGAAEAYHAVQAAEIMAQTSIASERGKAVAARAKAQQYATALVTQASAAGAEITGVATDDLVRFTADHAASVQSRAAFLLETRLAALTAGLTNSAMTIIDHRIPAADAPTLDFRPPGAPSVPSSHQSLE